MAQSAGVKRLTLLARVMVLVYMTCQLQCAQVDDTRFGPEGFAVYICLCYFGMMHRETHTRYHTHTHTSYWWNELRQKTLTVHMRNFND